ncbi:metal-sulfur cluster assembly factor [Halalkalibacter nanhaiisediminis]|uniref:Metal-sulfur cluster biosynthetic enzyme n=1 Tax=Halalkalibacter nanhaiisediminis TaxID=688079 RepID=A0A562Q9C1_9BACI|nr:iron-sulfur cluster assembly protein [Halalkalibacter nanhaiisediminis]TWI53294.1 metal-sulfur cluster biosynthetic enzyme [Halalkalibacter nanhaiisediminis]
MNNEQQVYEKLDKVYDPELDQPLTDLGFIDHVKIEQNRVEVIFRLPTYWCSPNFAYIMAEDIHTYVSELDWVKEVKVNLIDHCTSDEINKGVTNKKSFSESFENMSGGDLEALRNTFLIKAFYARQEKLIKYLLKEGVSEEAITTLSLDDLMSLSLSMEGEELREKYLEKKNLLHHSSDTAITTPEGENLQLDSFSDYLLGVKRTRLSMEFNAHYCRGLLEARYDLQPIAEKV